jgi:hypothetical protein
MKYPTAVIYRIALYVHYVCGMHRFTSRELWLLAHDAQKWYNERIPKSVHRKAYRIKRKHGFTSKQWKEIMAMSSAFYFIPPENADACNRELTALYKTTCIMNSYPYADNYTRALIHHAVKRGRFLVTRCDDCRCFRYRINPIYLKHPMFEKMWKED